MYGMTSVAHKIDKLHYKFYNQNLYRYNYLFLALKGFPEKDPKYNKKRIIQQSNTQIVRSNYKITLKMS